jgi:hypothetical protein
MILAATPTAQATERRSTTAEVPMTEATREGSAETSDELGRQVLIHLSRSMRIASMHQLGNDAVGATVQGLMTALAAAAQDAGAMSVQVNGDAVFYNRLLVKPRGDAAEATNHLRRTFERLDISEIRLAGAPTLGLMMAFLAAFKTAGEPGATPLSALQLDGLVVRRSDETKRGRDIDVRRNVARCYAQLQVLAGASFDRVREGRAPQLGRLRRGLQALVDAGAGHSSLMIGLACSVEFNVDEAGHATAVTALVLVMGERLGLSRVEQASLGLKALLHEAGAVVIPAESSTTAIAPRIGALSALAVRMTAVPHESMALLSAVLDLPRARNVDTAHGSTTTAAAIIAVACSFIGLTSGRATRPDAAGPRALAPDVAVRQLVDNAPRFEANALTLFVQTVGLFPPGTVVRLSGGETAVVVEAPRDVAAWASPIVKVVRDAAGAPADYFVDLGDPGETLRLVRSIEAAETSLNATHYLLL